MPLMQPENWPFWVICLVMMGAAWGNDRSLAMRNVVTIPFILTGWALGLGQALGWRLHGGAGNLAASLLCTFVPLVASLPFYTKGFIGAGSVKLQMGFSAWVGAFLGFERGIHVTWEATLVTALVLCLFYLFQRFGRKEPGDQILLPSGVTQFICSTSALVWALMT